MQLTLTRGSSYINVALSLPNTEGNIAEAFQQLDAISTETPTVLKACTCPVEGLFRYICHTDMDTGDGLQKLSILADKISSMNSKECWIFSGALAANSIDGIDDVLSLSEQLDQYILIPNVNTDSELGQYIAVSSQLNADPRFPEESWPYLDYAKIGAEFYSERGGAYTYAGYVLRKQDCEPEMKQGEEATMQMGGM